MILPRRLQPGDRAPEFTVKSVQEDREVSLSDFTGRCPLFLGLFNGLYCPFCRRSIVSMSASGQKLKAIGVESLAIVATDLDNARLYFRFRPTLLALAADPHLTTHRSYGVPKPELTPELGAAVAAARINPTGELPRPMSIDEASATLNTMDGHRLTATDQREAETQFPQLKGWFLIGRDGIVQWANIEGAIEGPAGVGRIPSPDEVLAAAQACALR